MGFDEKILSFMVKILQDRIRARAVEMVDEDWRRFSDLLIAKGAEFAKKASVATTQFYPFTAPAAMNIGSLRVYVVDGTTPPGFEDKTDAEADAIVQYGDWYLQSATAEVMAKLGLVSKVEPEQE